MQQYAESSVCEYLGKTLQPTFDKEKKGRPRAPFSNNTRQGQIDTIMQRAIKLSDRYRNMVQSGANETEIENAFNTKCDMDVFTWSREKFMAKIPYTQVQRYGNDSLGFNSVLQILPPLRYDVY